MGRRGAARGLGSPGSSPASPRARPRVPSLVFGAHTKAADRPLPAPPGRSCALSPAPAGAPGSGRPSLHEEAGAATPAVGVQPGGGRRSALGAPSRSPFGSERRAKGHSAPAAGTADEAAPKASVPGASSAEAAPGSFPSGFSVLLCDRRDGPDGPPGVWRPDPGEASAPAEPWPHRSHPREDGHTAPDRGRTARARARRAAAAAAHSRSCASVGKTDPRAPPGRSRRLCEAATYFKGIKVLLL